MNLSTHIKRQTSQEIPAADTLCLMFVCESIGRSQHSRQPLAARAYNSQSYRSDIKLK